MWDKVMRWHSRPAALQRSLWMSALMLGALIGVYAMPECDALTLLFSRIFMPIMSTDSLAPCTIESLDCW